MSKIRLDDMKIEDVKELYERIFDKYISKKKQEEIYFKYMKKYDEMKLKENEGYKVSNSMGRGFKYLTNVLYGWYIEELFVEVLKNNKNIIKIELTGNDSSHSFIYTDEKKVKIVGEKTTVPDFLLTLIDGTKIYLELKTSATEVYTIKTGNVEQLQKTMGETNIYSLIVMIDLISGFYEIKDISFFLNSFPFINNRMEGQLCYDFPKPFKEIQSLLYEKFNEYIKYEMFERDEIKKYKCKYIAERNGDKELLKKINSKIKMDKITLKFQYEKKQYLNEVDKILNKFSDINKISWDDILSNLDGWIINE